MCRRQGVADRASGPSAVVRRDVTFSRSVRRRVFSQPFGAERIEREKNRGRNSAPTLPFPERESLRRFIILFSCFPFLFCFFTVYVCVRARVSRQKVFVFLSAWRWLASVGPLPPSLRRTPFLFFVTSGRLERGDVDTQNLKCAA